MEIRCRRLGEAARSGMVVEYVSRGGWRKNGLEDEGIRTDGVGACMVEMVMGGDAEGEMMKRKVFEG